MNEAQFKAIIRQGFSLQNTADKAVLQVDQVLANAMSQVKRLVEVLPEEGLLRGRAWKDLEPLVKQELNVYTQQLGSAIENALVDAEPGMEAAAIREAKLGGADFGPETVSLNPSGGRVQDTVARALNSQVNNVTVKRLFNLDGKTKTSPVDQALFRTVDTTVRAGMINGTPTEEIARQMIGEVKRAGIPGVDISSGKVSKQIRSQATAMARTATQDMARQVKQEVYDANADAMEGMEYEWTTALDSRTCETCSPLDGRRWKDQKQVPSWPLHPNCRCQAVPVDPEDPFWNAPEKTAQVIRPFEKGAYKDGYKTPIKINGEKFYRKAVAVTSDTPPPRYSDLLAKWATTSETSLVEALGPTRARWFKKEYDRLNKDPQQILQAMLTGKPGAQKFIPIDKLQGKTLKLQTKKAAPSAYDKAIAAKKAQEAKAIEVKRQKAEAKQREEAAAAKAKADAAAKAEQAAKLKAEQAAKAAAEKKAQQAAADAKAKAEAAAKAAAAAKAKAVAEAKAKADALAKAQAAKAKAAAEAKAKQERIQALAAEKKAKAIAAAKAKAEAAAKKAAEIKAKAEAAAKAKTVAKPALPKQAEPKRTTSKRKTSDTNYDYDKNWEKLGYEKKSQYRKVREDVVEWSGNEFEGVRAAQFADARDRGVELNNYERLQTRRLEKGEQKSAGNRARRLEDFIDRAPKYDGTIRRGVALDTREDALSTIERYSSGKKNLAIESWTTDPGVSHRFAMGNGDPRPQRMSILVEGQTKGAPINAISGFDDEYEVLVPSGVRYEVVDVQEKFVKGNPKGGPATKMDHTDWTVTLREIKD